MKAKYQKVICFDVEAECIQPMHIGSGEMDGSVLVREADGLPFIQGTSLAGAFQDYVRRTIGNDEADYLFGSFDIKQNRNQKSSIVFSEGNFEEKSLHMEMRTRVSINGATGSVNAKKIQGSDFSSGQVLDMEYISPGSRLSFLVYLFDADPETVKRCFAAMHKGFLTIGGMNTIGCGRVKLVKVTEQEYDMTKEQDRTAWSRMSVSQRNRSGGTDITEELQQMELNSPYYEITAQISLRTPFIIHANEVDGNVASELLHLKDSGSVPDEMPILNGQKEFIIPGSSLKGVFRSRMETIAGYLPVDTSKLTEAFENKSSCMFEDAVIKGTKESGAAISQPRIRINKISGGVMDKKLFSEMTIGGDSELHVYVVKDIQKEHSLKAEAVLGLLLYVLRDLQIGAVSLGSGAGIGRGYIKVGNIKIRDNEKIMADFSMEQPQTAGAFVTDCLAALQGA